MKKHYFLIVTSMLLGVLYSCKKGENVKITSKNTTLILGKWMVYQKHTKVFELDGNSLLKDTVIDYNKDANTSWWFEIYNEDGTAYVTGKPYTAGGVKQTDTTSFLQYTITGSHLTLKPNGGGSETKPILNMTETDMGLEKIYNSLPSTGWGLDLNTTYHFVDDVYYIKQ